MDKTFINDKQKILDMNDDEYMNSSQRLFFEKIIKYKKVNIEKDIQHLSDEIKRNEYASDEGDKAIREEELRLLFRQSSRQIKLLPKYDLALERLKNDEYGYCLVTGERIGLERLMANPVTELCVEAKAHKEFIDSQYQKTK